MLVILYTAGNFGSTLEYCLRSFSVELDKVQWGLLDNGSMHGFLKEFHVAYFNDIENLDRSRIQIVTPTYPTLDYKSPIETLKFWKNRLENDKVVLIYNSSLDQAQRTQLFLFHKLGDAALDVIFKDKAQAWNHDYKHWRDMQKYELREAASFYIDQQDEHLDLDIEQQIPRHWYKLTPDDILWNFEQQIKLLLNYCGLTYNDKNIDDFYQIWFSKQKYILDEFDRIKQIIEHVVQDRYLSWQNLSIIGEGIVQSRLRKQGIELACYGLNDFPNNTEDLKKYFLV